MPLMYALMVLAGVSQFIKSLAGFLDRLPLQQQAETLGALTWAWANSFPS